jgi:pimeloyl-ACP methyl ester carboxylesterase
VGDVILLDQRGCGASHPALQLDTAWTFPLETPLERGHAIAVAKEHGAAAAETLRASGVDPGAYNTVESADDIAALCDALGVERMHLVGTSYGTHLAMAFMRRHPARVARAVLAGPEGPDHTLKRPSAVHRQMERIAARVRGHEELWRSTGNFVDNLGSVLSELEESPRRMSLKDPESGRLEKAMIGRFDVEYIVSVGAADTRLISILPSWFAHMALGDNTDFLRHDLLVRYLLHLRRELGRNAMGFCMDCASGASAARLRRIAVEEKAYPLGRTIDFPFPEVCEAWGVPDLGDDFRAPLVTDTPTLFLTGTWDCRTPAENVAELSPGFSASRHVVVEEAGHTDLLFGTRTANRVVEFLRGEDIPTTPIPANKPIEFVIPEVRR